MDGDPSMRDARAEPRCRVPKLRERGEEGALEDVEVVRAGIRQLRFRLPPHALVRIEFGRIGGEILDAKPWRALEERPNERAAVDVAVVPDDDDRAAQVPEQMAQEFARTGCANVVAVELEVEPTAQPAGTQREAGDDRDAVVPLPVSQDRSLPARCPGAPHGGNQEEARFVYEDEVGVQPRGVFFTRGHSRAFHRAIAASSRWSARRSGFCGVQPS